MNFCERCGWGKWIEPDCRGEPSCPLNRENVRKYMLRNKQLNSRPVFVYSTRYQGPEGKGDCYEILEPRGDKL